MSLFPTVTGVLPGAAVDMIGRLARVVSDSSRPALTNPTPVTLPMTGTLRPASPSSALTGTFTLTPDALRAALLDMGEAVTLGNTELAAALANMGLALTSETLTEARVALARAPGTTAAAYALARSLGFPATPGILRALTAVTNGIPANRALPSELLEWLSLAVTPDMEPEAIAAQLHMLVRQRARSVEGYLAEPGGETEAARHSRTLLLRLASASEDVSTAAGADALASHIEGQQLINLASQQNAEKPEIIPLYFAIPLQMPGEQAMLEMTVQPWDDQSEADAEDDAAHVQVTIRLATARLGRLQASLTGRLSGKLDCTLGAERPATRRLLERRADDLAGALQLSGWAECRVTCRAAIDWRPLWAGGAKLVAPRTRVDRRA